MGSENETNTHAAAGVLMTSLERLIRTHPIWFLPRVGRDDTVELLRGKEAGVRYYPNVLFKVV